MKEENELAGRTGQWSEWEMSEAKAKNRIPIDFTFLSGKSKPVFDRDLLKDLKRPNSWLREMSILQAKVNQMTSKVIWEERP